uniref:uncharacterized protein n=1 Tax=Lonchura striata TaxID=40157 RepID=UPI001293DDD1|nr:uncharacterized protein LOC116184375 [Lonchura striata domestica]
MLTTTSYAVSFLMVAVYAFESHRTVLGGRARPPAALQERSRCLESAWQGIPYVLAWLVPALTLLAQLLARGTSAADIAPVVPWAGSNDTFSLYCSSCLLLIHPNQDICSQSGGGKNAGLEEKIIFLLYLLLVLGCCSLLYRRVRLRCRGNAALPLLSLDRDGGFGGRSGRSVSKASLYFQLVFLLCWTPGSWHGNAEDPSTGMIPEDPSTGMIPEDPSMGMTPEDPGTGMTPEDPGTGMTPEDPGMGMIPEDPRMGMIPEDPRMGMTPEDPGMGMIPEDPRMGMIPEDPRMGMIPEDPGMGMTPEDPGMGMPRTPAWE